MPVARGIRYRRSSDDFLNTKSLCERIEETSRGRTEHYGNLVRETFRGVTGYPCSGGISVAKKFETSTRHSRALSGPDPRDPDPVDT